MVNQNNQYASNNQVQSNRIRESSSGALVGKNIAGIGGIQSNLGKSSSNILKDDRGINLTKINLHDPKQKFVTHNHIENPNPHHHHSNSVSVNGPNNL